MANLVKIEEQYKSIIETVRVLSSSDDEDVDIKFDMKNCNQISGENTKEITCEGVEDGVTLRLEAKITVTEKFCFKKQPKTIDIKIDGTNDKLSLTIDCEKCENCGPAVPNAEECNKNGTKTCGACECK